MTARILVVDDIATNRRLLEAKLQAEYYEVALAASGAEALDAVRSWSPDVVLLDIMMPGMDGYEVCETLKADAAAAHIPVVMVTALVDPAERVRGLQAGADDFLSKPVDDATLFARLRALLRVKRVQDAWRIQGEAARQLGVQAPAEPSLRFAGAEVLVLAQDPADVAGIDAALGADGMAPRIVAGAEEARDALAAPAAGFELAILCLPTDGGDTLRLASRLRAHEATRDLPVLLVADPGQRTLVLRGFDLGANDHVFRPMDPNELLARTRNQIRRKRYQDRLRDDLDRSLELVVTDQLTGLRNRRYAEHHLDALLRRGDAAVLMLDVDRFKALNDTYGHQSGDLALREVARRLAGHIRGADVVSRFGGEEFLVVLAAASMDHAQGVADRLREAIALEPIRIGGAALRVTASIGVALVPAGTPVAAAVAAADGALYRAKAAGRDRVEVATPADAASA